jgi:hypothetical protein
MRQSSYLSEKLWSSYRRRLLFFACWRIHTEASKEKQRKLSRFLKFIFRFIDDVLSLSYSRLGDFVDRIYPIELEIKDTTYTDRCASYLDLHLEIDSVGQLRTKLYDKRRFKFPPCELSIYMQQHSSSTCILSISLSVDTIFQSLWFLSGFPW